MEISLKNYKKLLRKIQQTISQTKKNIVQTVDYQKVLMSWQIGKEIDLHLKGQEKAEYGEKLFLELTKDIGIEITTLYQMRAFYKAYPKMPEENNSLSWSHYRSLVAVKDAETRKQLENLVVEKSLGSDRLQKEIAATKKKKTTAKKSAQKIRQLKVKRGKIFHYKISAANEIDLGFNIFLTLKHSFKTGEIVTVKKNGEKYLLKKSDLKAAQIHTYKAALEKVVDGDTIHAKLDLGFGIKHHEILRLAQINAPEIDSKEGKKSAVELKKILKNVPFLIVKTNKTDIYGRYVADVFFDENKKEINQEKLADSGFYLNQLLLDLGLVEFWQ